MVLLHLVPRRAGAIFRSSSEALADVMRIEFDYRVCVVHQHDRGEQEQGETGILADDSAVHDAILCVEFFSVGEGQGLHSNFFAEAQGDRDCSGDMCELMCRGAYSPRAQKAV